MLNLPPLIPVTDARLETRLSAQIHRLGAAGFPRVLFRGAPLGAGIQGEEWATALTASAENGGWPVISLEDPADSTLLGLLEGLHPAGDLGGVGPFRSELDPPMDLEALRQGCSLLRQQGIMPFVFGGARPADAEICYQAGAEALALSHGILCSPDPSALLWKAQCLRWRSRPPFQSGQGVALIGGSGCGKSTLARKLGTRLGLPVVDLDAAIVQRTGKSIARIFAEDGETTFRELETEVTAEAFRTKAVLALGGGAWESASVRNAAHASGFAVLWIAENPDRIWRRVAQDPTRPLAQQRETFFARWRTRMPHWLEAPMILPLGRTPRQLASALSERLGSR